MIWTDIDNIMLGSDAVDAVYLGDLQLWPSIPFEGFKIPSSIEFPKSGGTMQIRIKSHTTWEIGTDANWLTLSQSTGEGNTYVTVTATDNDTESTRNATITGQTLDEVYSDQCDVEQSYRIPYETMYFTIRSLANSNAFSLNNYGGILYSTDNGSTWAEVASASITINSGDTILMKRKSTSTFSYTIVSSSTQNYEIYGNLASLTDGDDFSGVTSASSISTVGIFQEKFQGDTHLISAENLVIPWGTIGEYCFKGMFYNCTSLTAAPSVLPALECPERGYNDMFTNCSSLVKAPEIMASATTGNYGMAGMFNGCSSLVNVPDLHLMSFGYASCQSMFGNCTSLVKAPKLPATTLVSYCYYYMFENCTSLSAVTCLATAGTSGTNIYRWMNNVSSTGTFYKSSGYTGWPIGASGIPNGWTVLDYSE